MTTASIVWFKGERAIVNAGEYKGVEVEILKPVGHEDMVLVRTVNTTPEDTHNFLVPELDLALLEEW
jgi:ribosomal protein L24